MLNAPDSIMFNRPVTGRYVDRTNSGIVIKHGEGFVYSKGFHDPEEFCKRAERATGQYFDKGAVQYRWVRLVPIRRRKAVIDNERMMMVDAWPDGKGVFPITCNEPAYAQ